MIFFDPNSSTMHTALKVCIDDMSLYLCARIESNNRYHCINIAGWLAFHCSFGSETFYLAHIMTHKLKQPLISTEFI